VQDKMVGKPVVRPSVAPNVLKSKPASWAVASFVPPVNVPLAKKLSRLNRVGVLVAVVFAAPTGPRLATRVYGTSGASGCREKRWKPRLVTPLRKAAKRVLRFRLEVLMALVPCAAVSSGAMGSRAPRAAPVFPVLAFALSSVQRSWRS